MRISAIIPTYNAAAYVEQAVASALAQTGVEMEVIVVDDGSTDSTWEILRKFRDRICLVRQVNGGPARARNHGAQHATGEWLAFLDADDEWLPHKTERQLARTDGPTDLIYSDRLNVGNINRVAPQQSNTHRLEDGDIFESLLLNNFITLSSVLFRKQCFDKLEGFCEDADLIGVEDWDLWLRYAAIGKVAVCHEPLVHYRWHPGGISNNYEHLSRCRACVLRRAFATSRGQQVPRRTQRHALAQAWECSAWFAATTQRSNALRWYLQSAYYAPFNLAVYKGMLKCLLGMA